MVVLGIEDPWIWGVYMGIIFFQSQKTMSFDFVEIVSLARFVPLGQRNRDF